MNIVTFCSLFVCAVSLSACGPDGPGFGPRGSIGSGASVAQSGYVDYGACATYPVKPGRGDQICNRHNGTTSGQN